MNQIPRLSEAVYAGMCLKVGTPTEVKIRREFMDIDEAVMRPALIMGGGFDMILSGSRREGFRLKTSDTDRMMWPSDHKVICDLSQISLYRIPQHTLILMECENLPLGFTRLKLMTLSVHQYVASSCVKDNNELYISSLHFRAKWLDYQQNFCRQTSSSIQHGPCVIYDIQGQESDNAYCFRSHHWPKLALPWIQRCQFKKWPPDYVLSQIIEDGCHVVPISSSPLNPETGCEWRISFSLAEQKLVSSMNHCQFLCYGMLKIFLKEVINADENESCLCSYFMKTVVFWVVQNDRFMNWVSENLLICFWTCFKLLISWVYKGECPNFFVPQNNMFRVKVVGQNQVALFDQLFGLYSKGITCLLLSPTIRKYLCMPILNRTLAFRTDEESIVSEVFLDVCFFHELRESKCGVHSKTFKEFIELLILIEETQAYRVSSFQTVSIQYFQCKLLQHLSYFLSGQSTEELSNKKRVNSYDKSSKMLTLASKIGCASEILYVAMFYFKNCQYEQSLRCLQRAQEEMSKPYIIYRYHVNEEMYRRAMAGLSLSEKLRKCLICDIRLHKRWLYIDEIVPEQEADRVDGAGILQIPPLVMLHMLFVLNHHRLGDTIRAEQSLEDLHTLLLYDDETHIPKPCRTISWQILGICHKTCGDYIGALNSFQCSLQQSYLDSTNGIQKATMLRIERINDFLLHR